MVTVQLHNLLFSGRHGVFEEELQTGNTFEVDLDVMYDDTGHSFDDLEKTVNYSELFEIVRGHMQVAAPLLEKIGDRIIRAIKDRYPFVEEIKVSIYKLQAPIGNFQGKAGITLNRKFGEVRNQHF